MAFTYATLVAAIYSELVTDENAMTTDDVNRIIRIAEERIYTSIEMPCPQKTVAGNLTAGNRFLSTPEDFLAPNTISIIDTDTHNVLVPKEVSFMREAYPTTDYEALPRFYAMHDHNTIYLAPTPDQNYSAELNYLSKPESIVTASTTWLGTNAESLLFSACVLEGHRFQKSEADTMTAAEKAYADALDNYANLGEGRSKRDEFRNNPARRGKV